MSEFANSGSYSESGYGMVWNAFKPSKTSLGSSGGSAVATAASLAGFGMGSQTGVSLYAPSTGASLVTLRGTDGIASGAGVMPLTWLQDFAGPMARTTSDIARILNATTGTDPDDLFTLHNNAGEKRPADYKTALDPGALQGKRIGYLPASFTGSPSYGQADGTMEAVTARFADIEAAGATMVALTTQPPSGPATGTLTGNRTEEGWQQYFDLHENPPYTTASGILSSPKVLPYNRQTVAVRPRMTAEDIQKVLVARDGYKDRIKTWMDENGVDAVVYPGFRSDVYDNDGAQTVVERPQQRRADVERRPADPGAPDRRQPARRPDLDPVRRPRVRRREGARVRSRARAAAQGCRSHRAGHRAEVGVRHGAPGTIGRHGPGHVEPDARRAGDVRRVHAGHRQGVHGDDDRRRDLHRR